MDNLARKVYQKNGKVVIQPPPQRSISPIELELKVDKTPDIQSLSFEKRNSYNIVKTKSNANVQKNNKSNFGLQAYRSDFNREKYEKRIMKGKRSSINTAGANNVRINQKVLEFKGESIQGPGI
jgi:hypothetical protein